MTEANNKKIGLNPPGAKVVAGTAVRYDDFEIVATEGESGTFKYYLNGDVVERAKRDEKGNFVYPVAICGRVEPLATFCDFDDDNYGVQVRVFNTRKLPHDLTFMCSELSQNPGGVAAALEAVGFQIHDRKVRNGALAAVTFLRLIATSAASRVRHKTAATATGWIKSADGKFAGFALPDEIVTNGSPDDFVFVPYGKESAPFAVNGTLEEWKRTIGRWSRASQCTAFALMAAFAAPLVRLAGLENNTVFNFWGETSKGKSTTLNVVASVFGKGCGKNQEEREAGVYTWNTTANYNEVAAEQHNDLPFVVDELGSASRGGIESLGYTVGNGQGRGRMGANGAAQRVRNFRLISISAAEYSYVDLKKKQGLEVAPGELARVVDIYATGSRYGLFWVIPKELKQPGASDVENGKALSKALNAAAVRSYGVAGREFMRLFVAEYLDGDGLKEKFREDLNAFSERLREKLIQLGIEVTEAIEGRVFNAFALVGFAGEKATDYGALPQATKDLDGWGEDEALTITAAMFKTWKNERETAEERLDRWITELIGFRDENAKIYTDDETGGYVTEDGVHATAQAQTRLIYGTYFKQNRQIKAVIFTDAEFTNRVASFNGDPRAIENTLFARQALIVQPEKKKQRKKYRAPMKNNFELGFKKYYYVINYRRAVGEKGEDDEALLKFFTGGVYSG